MAEDEPQPSSIHAGTSSDSELSLSKRKRKKKNTTTPNPHILHQRTIRQASWSYIHLQRISTTISSTTNTPPALDAITVQMSLNSSLTQLLGLHGSAIRFDIIKIESQDVWIRVSAPDRRALVAAVGGSRGGNGEGWSVKGWSSWDAGAAMGGGGWDLFAD